MRQGLKEKTKSGSFKLRGMEHTRIEGLSDGVFAIAIALLLIASDVPEKFSELKLFLKDFVPFGITIVLLMVIWYQHYVFFIRYGLRDARIVTLNTLLLFLILFYVYPLKFLFKTLFTLFSSLAMGDQESLKYLFTETIPVADGPFLMIIYGLGAASIFLTLALMYAYALRKKTFLELSKIEEFDTRTSLGNNLAMASVPILSVLIAASGIGGKHSFTIAGFSYFLYNIIMPIYGKQRKKLKQKNFPDQG